MAWELDCPSALSAEVPDCPSAQVPQCLSALSTRVPEWLKCPSTRVPFECPPSAQVPSECPSAWVPSESPHSAQRNFKLALTWTLNKKHYLGMLFWANNHKVLANSMVSFTLYLYNFFQGREKHMKKLLCINNTPQQTFVLVKNYWRRLEVVFRVKCFCLEDVFSVTFFCLSRRLQDIIARRLLENVLKTSWRRHLEDVFGRHLGRQKIVTLTTYWKTRNVYWVCEIFRPQDLLDFKIFEGFFKLTDAMSHFSNVLLSKHNKKTRKDFLMTMIKHCLFVIDYVS